MKNSFLIILMGLCALTGYAQEANNFPSSGDVGLGPFNRLISVRGFVQAPPAASNNWTRLVLSNNIYWNNLNSNWVVQGGSSADFSMIRVENGGAISFFIREPFGDGYTLTDNELSAYRFFTVKSNGNVGIGTNSPAEKLAVNGNIRAKEVKVETANWPDYVFEENYRLPSLMDLESYIKSNKHLPSIPDQKQVEEEGISLGEMNRKLLEKVEELTLYIIDLKKESDRQKQQIEKLKSGQ